MRYWFFDGNDVIGPFLPQELTARTDFSAVSMLAPETESENQSAWKMASSFSDFEFDAQTGQVKIQEKIDSPSDSAQPPVTAAIPPSRPPAQPRMEQPRVAKPLEPAKPIALAKNTEEILPLPKETQSSATAQEQDEKSAADGDISATDSAPATQTQPEPPQTLEPQPEVLSTCTLPTVEQAALAGQSGGWTEQEDALRQMLENAAVVSEQQEKQSSNEDLPPEEISTREVVKPKLPVTTEINAFLHEQEEAHRPNRKQTALVVWILLILLLPGIVSLAIYLAPRGKSVPKNLVETNPNILTEKSVVQTEEEQLSVPTVVEKAAEAVPPKVPEATHPTVADQAIHIVKNHKLGENKGTIASYFSRAYKKQLDSGYRDEWFAEPLHKSVYIVKYRLTKTRTEPIVYVFQVDVSKGKLTGALNNIALDLVGKI